MHETKEDFCGAPIYVGIGSRYPMQANANISNDRVLATSLGIVNYEGKTIAVVGTDDGQVMKVCTVLLLFICLGYQFLCKS